MSSRQLFFGVIIGSVTTTLIALAVLYAVKDYFIVNPLKSEEQIPSITAVTENDLVVKMIERVNPAVVSVVVTKDVPIYEQYYEQFNPWGWFGEGISIPLALEKMAQKREK